MIRNRKLDPVQFIDVRGVAVTMPEFIDIRK